MFCVLPEEGRLGGGRNVVNQTVLSRLVIKNCVSSTHHPISDHLPAIVRTHLCLPRFHYPEYPQRPGVSRTPTLKAYMKDLEKVSSDSGFAESENKQYLEEMKGNIHVLHIQA